MADTGLNFNEPLNDDGMGGGVLLMKDRKIISRAQYVDSSIKMPPVWNISDLVRKEKIKSVSDMPRLYLCSAPENSHQKREWRLFLGYLKEYNKVAIANIDLYELYIFPPHESLKFSHAIVYYCMEKANDVYDSQLHRASEVKSADILSEPPRLVADTSKIDGSAQTTPTSTKSFVHGRVSPLVDFKAVENKLPTDSKFPTTGSEYAFGSRVEACRGTEPNVMVPSSCLNKNYVRTDPSYLKTLGQAHSGWMFGAIAELVDNSRDAKAAKIQISIDMICSKRAGKEIPMLSVIDDGHGMSHQEVLRMISFGHKQPDSDDPDRIGRFGIGFKTGAMRLGRDALVLTQTVNSRSIAFLSQSLNEGKDNVEIPIVSYTRTGQIMEVDTSVQSEASAKYNLKAIKEFSPFNKYLIGEKAGMFHENATGTQIYIWNLEEWGSSFYLEWETGMNGGSSFHQGDIYIRSRRIRSRPGQMSRTVPLDYSLRSYLEVIFLDPRMKIYLQGSLVRSRPLAKSLNGTVVKNGCILQKPVQLTLGRCQLEREQGNCGIFLYWHGRLIEAYKRVGSMVHNGDKSHGIIGVIDVTDLMDDGKGYAWVHSNKQGFLDSEAYALLEQWLAEISNEYLDTHVYKILLKKGNGLYKPDHEWVQCDKCRKWRMLNPGFDSKTLPQEWFCYMKPFNGKCEMPEQKIGRGVITVSAKRSGFDTDKKLREFKDGNDEQTSYTGENSSEDSSGQTVEESTRTSLKRLRRGPPRTCRN